MIRATLLAIAAEVEQADQEVLAAWGEPSRQQLRLTPKPTKSRRMSNTTSPPQPREIRWTDGGHGQRAHGVTGIGQDYIDGLVRGLKLDGRNHDVRVVDVVTGEPVKD